MFIVETMMSPQETPRLWQSAECDDIPVMVTMTFNADGHTLYGQMGLAAYRASEP